MQGAGQWIFHSEYFTFISFEIRGERERSPPLTKITHPSHPHLGRSQASAQPVSAMEGPHPGGTAFGITVAPVPGKYA
jgi:hypothetical protein